jgi:hypothetical protein
LTYLIPVFFVGAIGRFEPSGWIVWIAMLYGVMFSTRASFRWSLPLAWRIALAYWGVLAAVTWPIVMLRESDFQLWWIPSSFGAVSAGAALLVMTGILWFDWLFSQYSAADPDAFQAEIIVPLGTGCIELWARVDSVPPYDRTLDRNLGPPFVHDHVHRPW